MRKHGWELPYHPLQVVAVVVFLALGIAFYVFFAPFVGKTLHQYIIMGVYTPLIVSAFGLYIWCAAADPSDPGVFKSKKYCKVKESKLVGESSNIDVEHEHKKTEPLHCLSFILGVLFFPCTFFCNCMTPSEELLEQQHSSEDAMFYCSLCEVEVSKYSKHCRVCDKCVDHFDHHCRWLNNCVGRRNYRQFFTLMVAALLLLILEWSTGILVLVYCFLDRKRYESEIVSKLGSSFSVVAFVIIVGMCTILAMIATLPIIQLLFFHVLLIKKGISTYDYIVALREEDQQESGGGQSPHMSHMSQASSLTGLSSASSFNTFRRGQWCEPPRMLIEDQFDDVVPPETGSVSSYGKKPAIEEPVKKKNPPVKISPWALARLDPEEVSKAAAEARKKSKILQPVLRRDGPYPLNLERDNSFGSSGRRVVSRLDHSRRRNSKRIRLPTDMPIEEALVNAPMKTAKASTSLGPLQLEARSAFRTSLAMSGSANMVGSSPESSLDSIDVHPFQVSSSGANESRRLTGLTVAGSGGAGAMPEIPFSRSTSDGYEASCGEDSDQVPTSRAGERPVNWSGGLIGSGLDGGIRNHGH